MNGQLTNQSYWDNIYKDNIFRETKNKNPIKKWILKNIKPFNGTCFEIGCFPGRYLNVFGELGYTLSGIDLHPGVSVDLPKWLVSQGYQIGNFYNEDFLNFNETSRYDIVCSFGFIEHFNDYKIVIEKHTYFLKKGGYLIITTPNFCGFFQKILHKTLDKKTFQHHNILAMDPTNWVNGFQNENYEIIYCGYIGGFDYWVKDINENSITQKFLIFSLISLGFVLKNFPLNSKLFSPYCGLIVKKK